jgi:DNA modification methylase
VKYRLIHADVLEALRDLPAESIDAVVTDPPYGLEFMGKEWDGAGGFRRSLNLADVDRANVFGRASRTSPEYRATPIFQEWCEAWARECLRVLKPGAHLLSFGGTRTYHRMACAIEDAGFEVRDQLQWLYGSGFPKSHNLAGDRAGWGTALKPANEPICLARKPFRGTVAANVAAHGTGALNIDGCRIAVEDEDYARNNSGRRGHAENRTRDGSTSLKMTGGSGSDAGRWPANVLLDEEAARMLDEQSGESVSSGGRNGRGLDGTIYGRFADRGPCANSGGVGDSGGASRFFYTAKASRSERDAGLDYLPETTTRRNHHPTVKPVALMRWCVRLVTPPGGTVLDPFCGSGSTGVAALSEGFGFVGTDREADFLDITRGRLQHVAPMFAREVSA